MTCPRCGLNYFRHTGNGQWMCFACGHVPFDGQWLAAAVLTGCVIALILAHAYLLPLLPAVVF